MTEQLDQFFTKAEVAKQCWDWLHEAVDVPADALYVEPSAGAGAFYRLMPEGRRLGYEIDGRLAKQLGVNQADWLKLPGLPDGRPIVVVGNPPFGYRGRAARDFINWSFLLGAELVAFILPPAFRPHANGDPPVAEKPLRLCHSIAQLGGICNEFDLPEGGDKEISHCAMVVYKRGPRPALKARPSWREDIIIKRGDEAQAAGADFYIRGDLGRPQVRDGVKASAEPLPAKWSPRAVQLPADLKYLRERLLAINWRPYIKPTPTNFGHINRPEILRAVNDALTLSSATCDSYIKIWRISSNGATTGMDKIGRCDLLLSRTNRYGSAMAKGIPIVEGDELPCSESLGIEILRDHERVKAHLLAVDWIKRGRPTTTKQINLAPRDIKAAMTEAGFIDEKSPSTEPPEPTCNSYVDIISISHKGGRDHAGYDLYWPQAIYEGSVRQRGLRPATELLTGNMTAVKVKRDRERVIAHLMAYDWAGSRASPNGYIHINIRDIRQAMIDGGFIDEPASLDDLVKLHYIVLVGKYRQREDRIDGCQLFIPARAYGKRPIAVSDRMTGTRCIGFEINAEHGRAAELRDWILLHDWTAAARPAPTTHRHIGVEIVRRELVAAGFAAEPAQGELL